jgi:hypothetical protein
MAGSQNSYTVDDIALISEKLSASEHGRHNEGELVKSQLVKTLTTFQDNQVDIGGFVGLLQLVELVRSDLRDLSGAVSILASFISRDLERKREVKRLRDRTRKAEIKKRARMETLFATATAVPPPPTLKEEEDASLVENLMKKENKYFFDPNELLNNL